MGPSLPVVAMLLASGVPLLEGSPTLESCEGSSFYSVEGFAPTTNGQSMPVNSGSSSCYGFFVQVGFGFHGDITISLIDQAGQQAWRRYSFAAAGVVPGTSTEHTPTLRAGPMTLVVTVSGTSNIGPAAGYWQGGVVLG